MGLNLETVWMLLSMDLELKGFGPDEVDQFYNGYGRYFVEGMAELCKYMHKNPEATKEEIVVASKKIQNYFWNMDYTDTEKQIRQISEERGYPEELIKAAMALVSMNQNSANILKLFDELKDARELAIEIIKRIEEHQAHVKELENFNREQDRVCEMFANKSYSADLLKDVKLAMDFTFSTHMPVEYDVIVRAVEQAENEADLRRRISPIIAVVFTELHMLEED